MCRARAKPVTNSPAAIAGASAVVPPGATPTAIVGPCRAQLFGINHWRRPELGDRDQRPGARNRVTEGVHGDHNLLRQVRRGTSPLRREADRQQRLLQVTERHSLRDLVSRK